MNETFKTSFQFLYKIYYVKIRVCSKRVDLPSTVDAVTHNKKNCPYLYIRQKINRIGFVFFYKSRGNLNRLFSIHNPFKIIRNMSPIGPYVKTN